MPLRTLPSNIEAENSVLGSCFLLTLFMMIKIKTYFLYY